MEFERRTWAVDLQGAQFLWGPLVDVACSHAGEDVLSGEGGAGRTKLYFRPGAINSSIDAPLGVTDPGEAQGSPGPLKCLKKCSI